MHILPSDATSMASFCEHQVCDPRFRSKSLKLSRSYNRDSFLLDRALYDI